uniref:Rhodanese domain-containing protein n=1 Tax=Ananas comosus var. bracteatus TaxID=296719 RepID=A0A6V7QTA8_ANACO
MALLINHLLLLHPPKPSPISQTLNPHQTTFPPQKPHLLPNPPPPTSPIPLIPLSPAKSSHLFLCPFPSPPIAIDAFRKLRDVREAQLLDIRKKKSVRFMASPNLRILGKDVVHVEFSEGDEDGFVKEVLKNYGDPQNTVICVLDNFGGDSLKVAELLFKNGFKEAYAIEGGLRGNDGWQAIQEKYLPPSMHVYPRKRKSSTSAQLEMNGNKPDAESNENGQAPALSASANGSSVSTENGYIEPIEAALEAKSAPKRPSSPYPKYHDLKPPSSPTPSKPQS